jgi:alpha-aminoadipic semialdehyde synthase
MIFPHVIKAQKANMPTLDYILKNNIRLIDYEKITDEEGRRLIAFGRYAGLAGAIDFISGLGELIMKLGYSTPLLNVGLAFKYYELDEAYAGFDKVAKLIVQKKLPK